MTEQKFTIRFTYPEGREQFTEGDVERAFTMFGYPNLYRDGAYTIEAKEEK